MQAYFTEKSGLIPYFQKALTDKRVSPKALEEIQRALKNPSSLIYLAEKTKIGDFSQQSETRSKITKEYGYNYFELLDKATPILEKAKTEYHEEWRRFDFKDEEMEEKQEYDLGNFSGTTGGIMTPPVGFFISGDRPLRMYVDAFKQLLVNPWKGSDLFNQINDLISKGISGYRTNTVHLRVFNPFPIDLAIMGELKDGRPFFGVGLVYDISSIKRDTDQAKASLQEGSETQ